MIPLYKPYMPDLPEMDAILHSEMLTYGSYTEEFEKKLRTYFGNPYLLVITSFQMAISVALTAMGLMPGDDIIASPMACLASTQPYLSYGLNVNWADVDPKTGTLAPESVENRITKEQKLSSIIIFAVIQDTLMKLIRLGEDTAFRLSMMVLNVLAQSIME